MSETRSDATCPAGSGGGDNQASGGGATQGTGGRATQGTGGGALHASGGGATQASQGGANHATGGNRPVSIGPSRREPPAWLAPVAAALGEALPRLHGTGGDPHLRELIGALTAALADGATELPLGGPVPDGIEAGGWPQEHRRALEASPLARDPDGPLVLWDGRVCWRRWHERRQAVLEALRRRTLSPLAPATAAGVNGRQLADAVARRHGLDPQQSLAVRAVLERALVLLEGGPGTGKTSTVAAMIEGLEAWRPGLRLHLAAPTGKAAARLQSATDGRLPCTTLHRLLESRGDRFGRDRHHPLELDGLVVDEVSMVDLELMGALLEALPEACLLVLVGDPAQLPPVAPGSVLLELQRPALRQALGAGVIHLSRVYRNGGAIADAADLLRQLLAADTPLPGGDPVPAPGEPTQPATGMGHPEPMGQPPAAATEVASPHAGANGDPLAGLRPLLQSLPPEANLRWQEASPLAVPSPVRQRLRAHLARLATLAADCRPGEPDGARALLAERERLLVLSPLRKGRWGLEALHRSVLGERAAAGAQAWPPGLPVLCTRNLVELGLANGDVGVLVEGLDAPGDRRLLFEPPGRGPLWLHPAQLAGAAEPALALTVHKAQGSEADEVVILLPQQIGADRRLLYTALTRARHQALLITPTGAASPASSAG